MAAARGVSPGRASAGSVVACTVTPCCCRVASTSSVSKRSDGQRTTRVASFSCARRVTYATASAAECTCATTPPTASNSCCNCATRAGRWAARCVCRSAVATAVSWSLHKRGGRAAGGRGSLCKARRTRARNTSWLLMGYALVRGNARRHGPFVLQRLLPALAERACCHSLKIPRLRPARERRWQFGEPAMVDERLLGQGSQGNG